MRKLKLKYHKELGNNPERWYRFSILEQLGNVGSDVERAIRWRNRGEDEYFQGAFDRTLELMDLTISDPKNKKRLKELLRVREALVDFFMYDNNAYKTSDEYWQKYFFDYAYAAAVQRGK